VPPEVRDLAPQHSKEAVERLIHWMKSDDGRISVAAANALLDRGYGRPVQTACFRNRWIGCGRLLAAVR
jgi:hypothetical protein